MIGSSSRMIVRSVLVNTTMASSPTTACAVEPQFAIRIARTWPEGTSIRYRVPSVPNATTSVATLTASSGGGTSIDESVHTGSSPTSETAIAASSGGSVVSTGSSFQKTGTPAVAVVVVGATTDPSARSDAVAWRSVLSLRTSATTPPISSTAPNAAAIQTWAPDGRGDDDRPGAGTSAGASGREAGSGPVGRPGSTGAVSDSNAGLSADDQSSRAHGEMSS